MALVAKNQASDDLAWLIEQVWGRANGAVHVSTDNTMPDGYRPVERFAVVPSHARARFVVPLTSRRAASRALSAYDRLRPPRKRAVRVAVGAGMRLGIAQPVFRDRLTVSVAADVSTRDLPSVLLTAHLSELLGQNLAPAMGIRPPGPNRKPVMQLFAPDGRAVAFAKLGWNRFTAQLVTNEVRALATVANHRPKGVVVPSLLSSGTWRGLQLLLVAPLPAALRGLRHGDPPPLAATGEVADIYGRREQPLGQSRWWRSVQTRLLEVLTEDDGFGVVLGRYLQALEGHADDRLVLGGWHGDWVPWNLAWRGDDLVAWDWEHSGEEAPLGFDLLHYHFQVAFVRRRRGLLESIVHCERQALPTLGTLGVRAGSQRLLLSLYLLELFLRYHDGMRLGTGWNPRFYPAVLGVLDRRAAAGLA